MQIIPGKKIANQILKDITKETKHIKTKPCLAVILIGRNSASHLYVSIKEKTAKDIGIKFKKYELSSQTPQLKIINLIHKLNQDKKISAILVQLPLPKRHNTHKILSAIKPQKDADGIHPVHLEKLKENKKTLVIPATTQAIIKAIQHTQIQIKNKKIAILGKSRVVGLPTYYYLKQKVKQINIYDKYTKKLAHKTKQANIVIVAIGKANLIGQKFIKQGAVLIDVGITRQTHKTLGDISPKAAKEKASWFTPVPGGVGPITVACLLKNVVKLWQNQNQTNKKKPPRAYKKTTHTSISRNIPHPILPLLLSTLIILSAVFQPKILRFYGSYSLNFTCFKKMNIFGNNITNPRCQSNIIKFIILFIKFNYIYFSIRTNNISGCYKMFYQFTVLVIIH